MDSYSGSAFGINAAFHMCLLGVEDWATANHPSMRHPEVKAIKTLDWQDTVLYVFDDCDKEQKEQFRNIYRTLRVRYPWVPPHDNRLWHAHDSMFFSDSKDSVGIQMADLCNYFLKRHLSGEVEPQNFYQMFAEQIICATPERAWRDLGALFKECVIGIRK
jgi:hypothetical protein